jgi:hypothetical protein
MIFTSLAVSSLLVGHATAWGDTGHRAVGYVAQQFLSTNALAFVQSSLGSTYNQSLGPAATWADDIKEPPETTYNWSKPLHYVNAQDSPLSGSCSVSQLRDCPDNNCILGAIANYTSRVASTSLSAAERQEALKFLDHFIGDIGQPLHVEDYKRGGNNITVKCSGLRSSLHSVWDSGILNKSVNANYGGSASTYANELVTRIKSGSYASSAKSWISCSNTTTPASKRHTVEDEVVFFLAPHVTITPLKCPLVWAQDSNSLDCSYVFSYTSEQDLCTSSYYTNAVPIIDLQIAKQGYRLAAWLNVIFDGATNL